MELDFLHQEFDLQAGDIFEAALDAPAKVMLLDPANFSYGYHGGHTGQGRDQGVASIA